jgi:hypothetical protein
LKCLSEVGGIFFIYGTLLTDLAGLERLTSLSIQISIGENPELVSLAGLENLENGGVRIADNDKLETLDGLSSLRTGGGVGVVGNALLSSLGLNAYEGEGVITLGSCLPLQGDPNDPDYDPFVDDNPSLTELDGLESMIDGLLHVSGQTGLTSVSGLAHLAERPEVTLYFQQNPMLSVDHLEMVLGVGSCGGLGDDEECDCGGGPGGP